MFATTRQRPAPRVLRLRGSAKGAPPARLARVLELSRKQLHTLQQRIQTNLNETAPTAAMRGTAFEADELDQNAGKKVYPTVIPLIHPVDASISAADTGPKRTSDPHESICFTGIAGALWNNHRR